MFQILKEVIITAKYIDNQKSVVIICADEDIW